MSTSRGAHRPLRFCLTFGLSLSLWACGSTPDDLREWRAEDHPAPPAVSSDQQAAPPTATPEETQARLTAALWTARCARCHGEDGSGQGPGAPPGAQMPNFQSLAYQQSRDDNTLARTVLQGRGMMPGFEAELTPEQIARLVRYLRGFAQSD